MKRKILYTKPSITDLEIKFALDAATNGWGEKCYDYISQFENQFAQYLGVKHALATSSCTGALHMGLAALGVGPGDEVILADTNWVATAAPIIHLGAKPVFVDILADTWCIDHTKVEDVITPQTKAIIATHLYGNFSNLPSLLELGEKFGISIIEDAAEALGTTFLNKKAGSMGRFGTFSFHGSKTITTGEGGMFVTNDSDLFQEVFTLSNHGRKLGQKKQFWPEKIGFKYKMSNLQAAIGCAQLQRIDELVLRKVEILDFYRSKIEIPGFTSMNPIRKDVFNGAWMPNVVFDTSLGLTFERISESLVVEGIDARPFFHPLSSTNLFGSFSGKNIVAYDLPTRSINLPSYHDIQESELELISSVVLDLL